MIITTDLVSPSDHDILLHVEHVRGHLGDPPLPVDQDDLVLIHLALLQMLPDEAEHAQDVHTHHQHRL